MSATELGAVLFDMDGLLVDSEPTWFSVERDVFARLGAGREWTPADAHRMVGQALEVSAAEILHCADADPTATSVEEVAGWLVEGMVARMGAGAPWKPGALALIAELGQHGVPAALVSSSHRRLVDVVLGQLPSGAMAASVAGDEVSHTKPHPAPYLRALHLLDVRAETAVVLEDSPTGARSGHSAGCTVVVVPDLAPMPAEHAWHEVESLAALDVTRLVSLLGGDGREDVEVGRATRWKDGREHPHQG
jgi:HAD superfamily hydrolase (TIGR01509 family)